MNVHVGRFGAAAVSRLSRGLMFYAAAWLFGAVLLTALHAAFPQRRVNVEKPAPAPVREFADPVRPTKAKQELADKARIP